MLSGDYAAALAGAIQKGFWDLLPVKYPRKLLFLKPNPLVGTYDNTRFLKKGIIKKKFEPTTTPGTKTSLPE